MRRLVVSIFLTISCVLHVTAAEAQPVANLPLTCPDAGAIGQQSCSNLTYQSPTSEQLIVLRSNGTWARAVNLASTETVAVCALPVQPGTYSSCRDESGARRIVYVAKSQVFGSLEPPPPPSGGAGARVLDLSAPFVISEPGLYVLDRDWDGGGLGPSATLLRIAADNVTLDMQGFGLSGASNLLSIGGDSATVKNGRLSTTGLALFGEGARSLIDAMRLTGRIDLYGGGQVLANSDIDGTLSIERGVIVRDNLIRSSADTAWAVRASEGAFVLDNQLRCRGLTCVTVVATSNVVRGNVISSRGTAIKLEGVDNEVLDNTVLVKTHVWLAGESGEPGFIYLSGDVAIESPGRNTIRGNYVEPVIARSEPPFGPFIAPWRVGIRFTGNGNRYGDNLIGADVPFELGSTVQVDLGGNHPITP
jgi:hypothetical protein